MFRCTFLLLGLATQFSAPTTLSTGGAVAPPIPLVEALQTIFGINGTNADFMSSLRVVIASFDTARRIRDQDLPDIPEVEMLVDALNSGTASTAYSPKVLELIMLEERSELLIGTDWKYGSPVQLSALAELLFARAGQMSSRDQQSASRYARAATLLAAHTNFSLTPSDLFNFISAENAQTLLSLSDDQFNELRRLVTEEVDRDQRFFLALSELYDARKMILALPEGQQLDAQAVEDVRTRVVNAWNAKHSNPDSARRFCFLARSTLRALQKNGNLACQAKVIDDLTTIERAQPAGPEKRWLNEVLEASSNR